MSHHFDTELAEADGRLDLCDLYLFAGETPQSTVLILTVNPLAGDVSPATFHPQGRYEFKIDTDDDAVEEISYCFSFAPPTADGRQRLELRRAEAESARTGGDGRLIAVGQTGVTSLLDDGGRLWAGLAADPFFGNGAGLDRFNAALAAGRFDAHAFDNAENAFHRRNSTGIVLEVPHAALGGGPCSVWATTTLWHPEEQVQVNRIANPLLLHLFHADERLKQAHNRGLPADDRARSGAHLAGRVATAARLAGSRADPDAYGEAVAQSLLPDRLAYNPQMPASYSVTQRNGRPLAADAMDAVLSLMVGRPWTDQVAVEGQVRASFPYLAPPVAPDEGRNNEPTTL